MLDNQHRANLLIGAVFAQLLGAWPNNVGIEASKILEKASERPTTENTHMFIALMSWLRYEGYVRYKALVGADFFYQVVLSEKGLRALNSMPEGISEHEFFGEKISEAATDISKDTTKKILADLVGQMIGGVIKSLSSG